MGPTIPGGRRAARPLAAACHGAGTGDGQGTCGRAGRAPGGRAVTCGRGQGPGCAFTTFTGRPRWPAVPSGPAATRPPSPLRASAGGPRVAPDELQPARLVAGISLGVRSRPGAQELARRGERAEQLELPVAGEELVVPLDVVQHGRA